MRQVQIGDVLFDVPSCYDECNPKQQQALLLLSLRPADDRHLNYWELVFRAAMGGGESFWRKLKLNVEQFDRLTQLCQWIFTDKLKKRPFDFVQPSRTGSRYLLPQEGLTNLTAEELSVAAVYFVNFLHPTEPEMEALDYLMATVCRPKRQWLWWQRRRSDWNGDEREPYNEARMMQRADRMAKLPIGVKVAFLRWWEYEFSNFLEEYSPMFGGTDNREPRYQDGRGWLMILKNVAQQGYFGSLEAVHKANAHTVWSYMLDDAMNAQDERRQIS